MKVGEDATLRPRKTSDHIFLQAQLSSGAPLSIEMAGGRPPQTPTHFEVTGTDGALTLRGGAMRGVRSGRLQLFLNEEPQQVNEGELATLPNAAANVAGIYAMLRDDILNGTPNAPDFGHAMRLTRLVDAVFTSAERGTWKTDSGWPTNGAIV